VLIYLESSSQQRILPTLHYALKPSGVLWLGTSETIGAYRDLFDVLDPKHKIFTKRPGSYPNPVRVPPGLAATGGRAPAGGRRDIPAPPDVRKEAERLLLGKYAPPGVLLSANMEILQVWGDTGDYLSPAPGKASLSLLKMLRPGLLPSVRAAVVRAQSVGHRVRQEGLRVNVKGGIREVAVQVIPVKSASADGTYLILFEARVPSDAADLEATGALPEQSVSEPLDDEVARLTQDLTSTREYLQAVIEQQEAAHEELQSSHEEIQSANEELQSVNEELETSKEEIQSSNEELSTVNDALNDRNRELVQTNDDLTNVLASVEMPILLLARDRRLRRFTSAAENILSLTSADLNRPIRNATLGLAIPDLDARLADVIDSLQVVEREVQDAHGRWHLLRIRPYKTLENLIDGAIVMLVDIDALRRAHEYAEGIVATVRAPLVVLDAELRVLRATAAFYETFAVTPENTEGRHLYELGNRQWDLAELRHLLEAILPRDRFVRDFEVTHEFETIGRRTMVLNARRLTGGDANIPMILLGIEDVTLRREQDATTRQRLAELAAADRAKDEFLAMLGHELRNPLNAVRNALQLVRYPAASGPVAQHGWEVMDRQVTNLTRLVGDLLDVARIAQGQLQIEKTVIEVAVVVRRAVDAIGPTVAARGQELELVLPSAPVQVEADAIRLEQALGNLLSNASKFTGQGGHIWVTVERTDVKDGADPGAVFVRVRDDGVGIEAHLLPRVFDLFTQADHSLARSQGGLGVGLTIVQRIVEAHGGQVEVRSSGPAQGSEFVVRLPACPGQPGETASETRSPRALASEAGARRVLVVDDSVDSAETMARLLRMGGHHVQVALDGASALDAAATFVPDIVLLDIGLPGMDGYQVGRQLRHVPGMAEKLIVALTGYGQEQDRNRSREAGFDEHLTKPVDHDALRRLLQWLPRGV
jgi:two-component system CheB/CheR fusion protein